MRAVSCEKAYPTRRDESGKLLCCYCGKPTPKGRRRYCSNECWDEVGIRCNPGVARVHVARRDKGVCSRCGLDTVALERALDRLRSAVIGWRLRPWARVEWRDAIVRAVDDRYRWAVGRVFLCHGVTHLWEADHVHPVAKGGGLCGLDNYQTLCIPCHGSKSGKQRRKKRAVQVTLDEVAS